MIPTFAIDIHGFVICFLTEVLRATTFCNIRRVNSEVRGRLGPIIEPPRNFGNNDQSLYLTSSIDARRATYDVTSCYLRRHVVLHTTSRRATYDVTSCYLRRHVVLHTTSRLATYDVTSCYLRRHGLLTNGG